MTPRAIILLVVGAMLVSLAVALSGCPSSTLPRKPDQAPLSVKVTACFPVHAPPTIHGVISTCPPHVCISDDDAHALAREVDDLTTWSAEAWDCRGSP